VGVVEADEHTDCRPRGRRRRNHIQCEREIRSDDVEGDDVQTYRERHYRGPEAGPDGDTERVLLEAVEHDTQGPGEQRQGQCDRNRNPDGPGGQRRVGLNRPGRGERDEDPADTEQGADADQRLQVPVQSHRIRWTCAL